MNPTFAVTALLATLSLVACDLNEGPAQEMNEAVEDIADGQPIRDVVEQAGGVVEGQASAEQRLDSVDAWLEARRREIRDGTREVDADVEASLDDIERRAKKARDTLSQTSEDIGDDIERAINDIEFDMDDLFDDEGR